MNEVKDIFNNTYKLYNAYKTYNLFYAIIKNLSDSDTDPEQVTKIMADTYNFYVKYQNCWKDEDWMALIKESHVIDKKYDCQLCRDILLELISILEQEYKNKGGNKGG